MFPCKVWDQFWSQTACPATTCHADPAPGQALLQLRLEARAASNSVPVRVFPSQRGPKRSLFLTTHVPRPSMNGIEECFIISPQAVLLRAATTKVPHVERCGVALQGSVTRVLQTLISKPTFSMTVCKHIECLCPGNWSSAKPLCWPAH